MSQSANTAQVVVRLRLIGQMEAWTLTSESVLPAGRKTRALLAVIALSAPRPALRGRLAELLWSRRPEEQARASLRQEIHRLLESLTPANSDILQVTRDHLSLRPGAVWIDVEEVMRATIAEPASLSLLDGDLLEDLDGIDPTFDAWLTTERERLRDRARTVAEELLREQVTPEHAIPAAQQLLSIDRAHEGAWRALMRAHADRGERGMAIQAYDRCRAVLADLLDAGPSPETQKLLVEIRGPSGSRMPARPAAPPVQLVPPSAPEAEKAEQAQVAVAPATARVVTPATAPATAPPAAPTTAEPADDDLDLPEPSREIHRARGGARVGVMPLQLVGTTVEESHLAPGLAEEITTALSRFRWMFVVSSSSLGRFAQDTRDETAIRRTFGVDFLLDGTIQRVRERLRITLRLLDLRAGNQVVWARRFDRQSNDLLSLQDEIASEVVAQIDPEILLIEAKRIASRPVIDANAYDLVLRALPLMNRLEHEQYIQAGAYLARAIELEPEYAAAHAWYAYWHIFLVGQGWAENTTTVMENAGNLAERAIMLDPYDARALTIAGHVRAFLHRRLREAAALHERALMLNPNLPMAWALSAATYAYMGDTEEAERRNNRYKKLSPLDPHAFLFDAIFTLIHLMRRDYEAAVIAGRANTQVGALLTAGLKYYLSALGHLGRTQEAAVVRRRLLSMEPDFTVERFVLGTSLERESDKQHVAEGLRLTGIPETDVQAVLAAKHRQQRV
jgi:DNA-binding SARP family transcriptional activator/TolB-like protein